MALMQWRPFDQGEMQSEVNRFLDTVFGRSPHREATDRAWTPTADMYETKDELVIKADLPGMSEKDVQVTITGDLLSLKGQRVEPEGMKPEQYFRAERWEGRMERIFQLPIPVQADKVRASYRDGVLTVTLPKVESVRPREIKIDVQ